MAISVARTLRSGVATPAIEATTRQHTSESVVTSHALFGADRQIGIDHAGQRYCLRITQNNKLILTK